jgi:nucleoside-diphosphate-sugar epimerase
VNDDGTRDDSLAAVTGASGFLGDALVARLITRRRVRALYRTPTARSAALQGLGCDIVTGNLDDERALAALVEGADEVYHCAATMAKTDPALSHHVNVEGTEHVARAALAAGVRRFVYISSTSVYAASCREDNTYSEAFEPEHVDRLNHYSRTKYEGEGVVRRLAEAEGLRFTIIRPTNIYGLRSRPWFRQWEGMLRRMPVAFGRVPIDVVYVKDVVMALEWAAASQAALNEVFNVGHEMVRMSDFVSAVACVIGRDTRTLPPRVDRGVCVAIDRGFSVFTHTQMSPSLVRPAYYPHAKARAAFGYFPQYRLLDGMAEMKRFYHDAA